VTPALYVLLPALVLGNMFIYQWQQALVGVVFIALGAGVYFTLGLGRTLRLEDAAPGHVWSKPPPGDPDGSVKVDRILGREDSRG
jgi:hypothetical protein